MELTPITVKGKTYVAWEVVPADRPVHEGAPEGWEPTAYVKYWAARDGEAFGSTRTASASNKPGTVGRAVWDAMTADTPSETEKENTMAKTAPKAEPQADVDELISDVHEAIDQMGNIDPASEGAHGAATALKVEAEEKIRQLPTAKRTALRKSLNDAFSKATTVPEPAAAPAEPAPAPAPTAALAPADSTDPADYPGVAEVIAQGVSKAREGVELGLKLTTAGEEMARIMLNMRSLVTNPDTGLPDLMADRKTTRNFATRIYREARNGVAETDVERLAAHNSLVKATQNKMSDVLVDWLAALDAPESAEVVADLFPAVSGAEKPSEAIRALYAEKGIDLPSKGRTEIMREHRKRKALEAARKEREALIDSEEPGAADELEKVDAKINDLVADLGDAAEPEPVKTDAQRANEAVAKLRAGVETAGKRMAKLKAAEKRKIKAELYALIREAADTFELDLSALAETE